MEGLLDIVFVDEHFVVINKESGMLAVPGRGEDKRDCVSERVKRLFRRCIEQPAVHRLDMDTSGLMVVALTSEAHRELSRQFHERETFKKYVALLEGILELEEGVIELPFRLDVENRPIQIYDEVHGKWGITRWKKVGIENGLTRVEFWPLTGRTHQLRLHASHEKGLAMPIAGDPFYGNAKENGQMKLHACELGFKHPITGENCLFSSEPSF